MDLVPLAYPTRYVRVYFAFRLFTVAPPFLFHFSYSLFKSKAPGRLFRETELRHVFRTSAAFCTSLPLFQVLGLSWICHGSVMVLPDCQTTRLLGSQALRLSRIIIRPVLMGLCECWFCKRRPRALSVSLLSRRGRGQWLCWCTC